MYWYDFGGGSALKAIYDAVDERGCIPIDDFYMENVENRTIIHSGAEVTSWVNLYAADSNGEYDLKLIGDDSTAVITLADPQSYLVTDFDPTAIKHHLDFYGGAVFGSLVINTKQAIIDAAGSGAWTLASIAGLPAEVSTSDGYFPLSHVFDISLNPLPESESTAFYDANTVKYKLLNSARLHVAKGASFKTGGLAVYDGTDYLGGRGTHASSLKKSLNPNTTPAEAIVDGQLTADLVVGTVETNQSNSKIVANAVTSTVMFEPKEGTGKQFTAKMLDDEQGWFYIPLSLTLRDSAGDYRDYGGSLGSFSSKPGDGYHYWELTTDNELKSVSISSPNGFESGKNAAATFNLSSVLNPTSPDSRDIQYDWSVAGSNPDGGTATLTVDQNDPSKATLHLPANSSEDTDGYFTVTLKVTAMSSLTGEQITVATSERFIAVHKDDPCFEAGTIVLTKAGAKKIENLEASDLVVSYDQWTGELRYSRIALLVNHGEDEYAVMELHFDDGSYIGFINSHCLFSVDDGCYLDFRPDNFRSYVGKSFLKLSEDGKLVEVKLVKAELVKKTTTSYTVISSEDLNCFGNGLLNLTTILKGIYNIFDCDSHGLIERVKAKADIEKYGLFGYADFREAIPEQVFVDFGFKYFKVAMGKGILDKDTLDYYIRWFYQLLASGEGQVVS